MKNHDAYHVSCMDHISNSCCEFTVLLHVLEGEVSLTGGLGDDLAS